MKAMTSNYRTEPGTVCATWLNIMGEISLRAGIDLALESEGPYTEGTADRAEHAYRAAIAEAFADTGIVLAGDEFIRPVSKQVDWEDLASAIKSVNFWEIIERAIEDTACEGHESLSGAIGTTAYCDGSCR